jgi:3-phosphoshikimate 1-carboxyvinyltransferase
VAIASLADGRSTLRLPLDSLDTRSSISAYRQLGVSIEIDDEVWVIDGTGGRVRLPDDVIDVGNSGTTLRMALGSAALIQTGLAILTGDAQIRARPAGPLAQSLTDLGADVRSTRGDGRAPFVVGGKLRGGKTSIDAVTSQYLSSLLINAPLADGDSEIVVTRLNEAPYVWMTLDWLDREKIKYSHNELREFRVEGSQSYRPFDRTVPGDFSSATFFLAAGALPGNDVSCLGLDMDDTQGDKAVVDYLVQMGADVEVSSERIRVRGAELRGADLDLNATPDALPMLAVLGCFAAGQTRLYNVPQARLKETDRLASMAAELKRMGGDVEELPDGLLVRESPLRGAEADGRSDHRIVMSLAVAGSAATGQTTIATAQAAGVTFPTFADCMRSIGAEVAEIDD